MMRMITATLVLGLLATGAAAHDFYVAPASDAQSKTMDGSVKHPFTSVQEAVRSDLVSGGDRIILRKGEYGTIKIVHARFDTAIEIISETQGAAHADQIIVQGSQGLYFKGISVWPRKSRTKPRHLVHAGADATNIRFDAMDIRGNVDAPARYMNWSKAEWLEDGRTSGVRLDGANNAITNSRLTGVAFGITTSGDRAVVRGNRIEGFSGDAMRGLGNGSVFEGNKVENCFKVDKNHDDGFQSWATKKGENGRKTISDMVIENNIILEWTGPASHPLHCTLQGIGLFDGIYKNFTIRNNLIAVSAYHGIALYGGTDSRIVNNTVVNISGAAVAYPWIMLSDHKNGWKGRDLLVTNNVAMAYKGIKAAAQHNAVSRYLTTLFRDPEKFDFRLMLGSPLVDAGTMEGAPEHDILGTARTGHPDLGAFELQ